jgi:hypothetical protein
MKITSNLDFPLSLSGLCVLQPKATVELKLDAYHPERRKALWAAIVGAVRAGTVSCPDVDIENEPKPAGAITVEQVGKMRAAMLPPKPEPVAEQPKAPVAEPTKAVDAPVAAETPKAVDAPAVAEPPKAVEVAAAVVDTPTAPEVEQPEAPVVTTPTAPEVEQPEAPVVTTPTAPAAKAKAKLSALV